MYWVRVLNRVFVFSLSLPRTVRYSKLPLNLRFFLSVFCLHIASARHSSQLLYREKWPSHSQGTERRSIIHPRLKRGKIGHVCQRSRNGDKHRVFAQANRPHKPPTTTIGPKRHPRPSISWIGAPPTEYMSLLLTVGDEAVNAEDHTATCGEEEPAYRRNKTKYA